MITSLAEFKEGDKAITTVIMATIRNDHIIETPIGTKVTVKIISPDQHIASHAFVETEDGTIHGCNMKKHLRAVAALDFKEFVIVRYQDYKEKTLARFPYYRTISPVGVPQFVEKEEDAYVFKSMDDVCKIRDLLSGANLGWLKQFTFQILITNVNINSVSI